MLHLIKLFNLKKSENLYFKSQQTTLYKKTEKKQKPSKSH